MNFRALLAHLALCCVGFTSPVAQLAERLYGVPNTGPAAIVELSMLTGQAVHSMPLTDPQFIPIGMTHDGVRLLSLVRLGAALPVLVEYHPGNASSSIVGETGQDWGSWSIAWNSTSRRLYALAIAPGTASQFVYEIDRSTGLASVLTPVNGATSYLSPFAIDANGGAFGVRGGTGSIGPEIYALDLASGQTTLVGNLGISSFGFFHDLAFDSSGRLWGSYRDTLNGATTGMYLIRFNPLRVSLVTTASHVALATGPACEPATYCTGKPNSLGCTPAISGIGLPSPTASSGFVIRATNVRNQRTGILLYGVSGRAATPFQGGVLCIAPPVRRGPQAFSDGSLPPSTDCTGAWTADFNAFAWSLVPTSDRGQPIPSITVPGTVVTSQWWGRDAPGSTALTDALEFTLCP